MFLIYEKNGMGGKFYKSHQAARLDEWTRFNIATGQKCYVDIFRLFKMAMS